MFNRRALLQAFSAAAVTTAISPALARAPLAGRQVAGVYRTKVGAIEVTAISDGVVGLTTQAFQGAEQSELKRIMGTVGQTENLSTAVNTFVVNTGTKTYLVDTGAGSSKAFGPTLGRMRDNLAAAGIMPSQIDAVILTHAHTDHAEGLLTPGGTARFRNAEIIINEAEINFWLDDANLARAPEAAKGLFASARKSLAPYAARTRKVKTGEVVPGISLEAAYGHTPGHSVVRIASGKDQLLLIGDTIHNATIHTARPDVTFAFDIDGKQAAESRKRVFDMVSADGMLLAATHVAFPGFGKVLKDGSAYKFVPADWSVTL